MPLVGSAGSDDLASSDEIKVFTDEGGEEKRASAENLTDLKSSLVTEGEQVSLSGKSFDAITHPSFGYALSSTPYLHHHHHPNGTLGSVPMVSLLFFVFVDNYSNVNTKHYSLKYLHIFPFIIFIFESIYKSLTIIRN
jgi:transcription factor 7-like 2